MSREHRSAEVNMRRPRMIALRIDGSVVTTSAASTGLLVGGENATVAKGSGGASNEVTISLLEAMADVPVVQVTPITTNCHVEIKSVTSQVIVLETFEVADGTTGVDDADLHVLVVGPMGAGEVAL